MYAKFFRCFHVIDFVFTIVIPRLKDSLLCKNNSYIVNKSIELFSCAKYNFYKNHFLNYMLAREELNYFVFEMISGNLVRF